MATTSPQPSNPVFFDAGAIAGLIAAGLVAAAWAFVHFGSDAQAQTEPQTHLSPGGQESQPSSPPDGQLTTTVYVQPTQVAPGQALSEPSALRGGFDWQLDERWYLGMKNCQLGFKLAKAAEDNKNSGKGGSYRAEQDAAREKLETGLRHFQSLAEDYQDNSRASREIEGRILKYQKVLTITRK